MALMNSVLADYQARVEQQLDHALSNIQVPERLLAAMRYSTLGGGKRIRAMLVYAAGVAVNAPPSALDQVAASLECIHAYSLIHDDLPAMDDDALRRGRATTHIRFDEATAILAGDALLTLAFELITDIEGPLTATQSQQICSLLARNAGQIGMVGGQILDIQATGKELDQSAIEDIHRRKTGALINAAVLAGAYCASDLDPSVLPKFQAYADNLGLAFQVVDDILDIESSTAQLGKQSGADQALGKSTYPAMIGLDKSKQLAQKLYQQAVASASSIGDNSALLIDLAALVVKRNH